MKKAEIKPKNWNRDKNILQVLFLVVLSTFNLSPVHQPCVEFYSVSGTSGLGI